MSYGLPNTMHYQSRVESSAARSYRSNIQPQGSVSYGVGDTLLFNIPTRPNLTLAQSESYVKFTVTVPTVAALDYARLDSAGAASLIANIKIMHGSNLLSEINNYNLATKMLLDLQASNDAIQGKYAVAAGCRSDMIFTSPAAAIPVSISYPVSTPNSGFRFLTQELLANGGFAAIAAATSVKQTFCVTLNNLLGTMSPKYFPLFACTSAPISLQITFVNNVTQAMALSAVAALPLITITSCEFVAQFVELSDSAMSLIYSQIPSGEQLQYAFTDIKSQSIIGPSTVIAASANNQSHSIPISAKYSSLKALLVCMRNANRITGVANSFSLSCNKFLLSSYQFRVGPMVLPNKEPNCPAEYLMETLKAVSSLSDIDHAPSIDYSSFNQDYPAPNVDTATTTSPTSSGSFYIGIDMENYGGSDKSQIFSGFNSNNDDIMLNTNFLTNAVTAANNAADTSIRYDIFHFIDSVICFENGQAYVKY